MKKLLLTLLFSFFILNCFSQDDNYYNKINTKYWTVSDDNNLKIDSCVEFLNNIYELLHHNKIIPDAFTNDNETKLGWVDSCSWTYSTKIDIEKKDINLENISLILNRVNTFSSVYINNKLIGETNNEFLEYRFDIKPYLREGENDIKIIIEPAYKKLDYESKDFNTLESEKRVISRKAQYRYGWDWHPKMLSCGINEVYIEMYNQRPKIEYFNIQTLSISEDKAKMILNIGLSNLEHKDYKIILKDIKAYNPNDIKQDLKQKIQDFSFDFSKENKKESINEYSYQFTINSPYLWNTKELGEQYLYKASIEIASEDNSLNKKDISFGIRTIELIQEKDEIGQSFYFKLNGKPLFIKGANYIAQETEYANAMYLASGANMNMLRVWGGSRYSDDSFYNYCNENGILVWQDFPFACALYPGDIAFLENVRLEAEQNIRRIANNPSLALFCGNNEIWEGWMNWGWKQEVEDTIKVVENYNNLFNKLLPELVNKYSPTINYIHTSPLHGWGRKESLTHGDCHYWGVWWADSTFETYTRKVPRFMSEYGFQGIPNAWQTGQYANRPFTKTNKSFTIHQKHPRGFELIDNRIEEYFGKQEENKISIFRSQAVQQEAYKVAIEAHRRAKPYCMGTLFWQLNEPYTAIGWGCFDYYYKPKAVYHTIRKAYEPIILSIDKYSDKDSVFIYYCNDKDSNYNMNFVASVHNNKGEKRISLKIKAVKVNANLSEKILSICLNDIKGFNPKTDYIYVEGKINNLIIDDYSFFVKPIDYVKADSWPKLIKIKKGKKHGTYLKSNEVIRNVILEERDRSKYKGNMIIDVLPHKHNRINYSGYSTFYIVDIIN